MAEFVESSPVAQRETGVAHRETPAHHRETPVSQRETGVLSGLHRWLGGFPTAFFTLALVTDIEYWRSANLMWQYFSIWLIVAALITGGLAVLVGIVDFLTGPRGRRGAGWHFGLTVLALLVGLWNAFVHSRDGWTAVVPEGIILSVVTVVLLYGGGIAAGIAAKSSPLSVREVRS